MNRKASLYALIGGIVGGLLVLAVCSVMPIGAQNGDATFGKITCSELQVKNAMGPLAQIGSYYGGGRLMLYTQADGNPFAQMYQSEGTGRVLLSHTNGFGVGLSAKSMWAHRLEPIYEHKWGELVLFNGNDRKEDVILPMALAEIKWGACDCP